MSLDNLPCSPGFTVLSLYNLGHVGFSFSYLWDMSSKFSLCHGRFNVMTFCAVKILWRMLLVLFWFGFVFSRQSAWFRFSLGLCGLWMQCQFIFQNLCCAARVPGVPAWVHIIHSAGLRPFTVLPQVSSTCVAQWLVLGCIHKDLSLAPSSDFSTLAPRGNFSWSSGWKTGIFSFPVLT